MMNPNEMVMVQCDDTPALFDAMDPDELAWWRPVLGPSSTLVLSLLLTDHGCVVRYSDLEFETGLRGPRLVKAMQRLIDFRCAYWSSEDRNVLVVHRYLPGVTAATVARAPEWWQLTYRAELERKAGL